MIDPEAIIAARPKWSDVNTTANAASMDTPVHAPLAAAHRNMFWNAEINGLGSITDGTGTLKHVVEQMLGITDDDGRKKEDEDDGWGEYVDAHKRREEAKREMEERWANEVHGLGDVEMTGIEWGEFSAALSHDTLFRRQMIERLMREKKLSEQDAAAAVDRAARLGDIMRIPASERTEAQQADINAFNQGGDPNAHAVVRWGMKRS